MTPTSVPELSPPHALHRGRALAREDRVQDNLHAHVQNQPIRNYVKMCALVLVVLSSALDGVVHAQAFVI